MRKDKPKNINVLKAFIQKEWEKIEEKFIMGLINTMKHKCLLVVESKGRTNKIWIYAFVVYEIKTHYIWKQLFFLKYCIILKLVIIFFKLILIRLQNKNKNMNDESDGSYMKIQTILEIDATTIYEEFTITLGPVLHHIQ